MVYFFAYREKTYSTEKEEKKEKKEKISCNKNN